MKKILVIILCLFFPFLAFADSSALFTPPTTDYSVIFLGNLFGVVDGVLHGTGSQIMGKMFLVVNSAVLALGGIMVTYILIVGTMNTSHEGQFLGQKWSGIWIPMRGVIGLALIMPKASGYCLMQIFIMWITVQGVGAADKVWNAALEYLNTGGVFVGAQSSVNPTTDNDSVTNIATGESAILQGQVCMYALQKVLETARTSYKMSADNGGPCYSPSSGSYMDTFCNTEVPDFINTFSATQASANGSSQVPMPHFTNGTMYEQLNGICGTVKWNKLDVGSDTSDLNYVSSDELEALNQSRAIAIDQMYMDLMPTAMIMVTNDPDTAINSPYTGNITTRYSTIAQEQYGVPYLSSGTSCTKPETECNAWQPATGGATSNMLFNGAEFMYAMTDYNAIMMPTLNLMAQNANAATNNKAHEFISNAKAIGWIMASSYFFDLVRINQSAAGGQSLIDTNSGLETSIPYADNVLQSAFNNSCSGVFGLICQLLNKKTIGPTAINNLITGNSVQSGLTANVSSSSTHAAVELQGSASTYGYITNASMIHLPGQAGLNVPKFDLLINIKPVGVDIKLPEIGFPCVKFMGVCWGKDVIGKIIYDSILKTVVNFFLTFLTQLFSQILQILLIAPLTAIMTILYEGVQNLNTSQFHPIVGLAFMGTSFINFVTQLYFQMVALGPLLSMGGGLILAVILPFISAWGGIMFLVGFLDAYYVPFLPYMIFTFGSLGWFIAVMEAMVAGPIVAFGIMNPEGHEALGKAEGAVTILLNVFLRPSMMILGFIGGISLSYVGIYVLNSGFQQLMQFFYDTGSDWTTAAGQAASGAGASTSTTPYSNFAALYAGFFCLLTYTTIYVTLVEKSFSLIHILPDNMSRWMGGQAESHGKEAAQWAEQAKQQITEASKETGNASIDAAKGTAQSVAKAGGELASGLKGASGMVSKKQ